MRKLTAEEIQKELDDIACRLNFQYCNKRERKSRTMEFEPWYREVVNGLSEHLGGILVPTDRVKKAHARGYTPAEFIIETLMEIEKAQAEYDEEE